jgi:hypothetical protein
MTIYNSMDSIKWIEVSAIPSVILDVAVKRKVSKAPRHPFQS